MTIRAATNAPRRQSGTTANAAEGRGRRKGRIGAKGRRRWIDGGGGCWRRGGGKGLGLKEILAKLYIFYCRCVASL